MNLHSTLQALFGYNDWARDRLFEWARTLDSATLDRQFSMGAGTIKLTLYHLWEAERRWLDCWNGDPDPTLDGSGPLQPMAELHQRFETTRRDRERFFSREDEDGLRKAVVHTDANGREHKSSVFDLAVHVCSHGVHHRAQALNMLRRVGVKVRSLDYIFFKLEGTGVDTGPFSPEILQAYYRYGDWAQQRLRAIATELSDEQLDRSFEIGVGCLRKTLLHMHDAEQWWLNNWSSELPVPFEELPSATTIGQLDDLWQDTAARRNAFLAEQSAESLARTVEASFRPDSTFQFPVGDSMIQICGHGTHHRAQALNMLRQLGAIAPPLDYSTLLRQ